MSKKNTYSDITQDILELTSLLKKNDPIPEEIYLQYDVKRGLRDISGRGVLAGLTGISDICAFREENGKSVPAEGELFYRGINVSALCDGFIQERRFGFEETLYLLLFGTLPDRTALSDFCELLSRYRTLPTNFVRDVVMKAPAPDLMNAMARGVLTLASYDPAVSDLSPENVLRQCLQLTAVLPLLATYCWQSYNHYCNNRSLIIHSPKPTARTAETLLSLLRPDGRCTELEAEVLDLALVLHAEHGGGNNSAFTMHVVTSSGTDTYSAFAASLCSLKGVRHGGANNRVCAMMKDMEREAGANPTDDEISAYLSRVLAGEAYDKTGIIYGFGHAVYSLSDPRAVILRRYAQALSEEKGLQRTFELYSRTERIAASLIAEKKRIYKGVSANVDFYSGFVYSMLGIPPELFTPLFAVARMAGWSAHRMEELINNGKIIRPAYRSVCGEREYIPIDKR